MKKFDPSQRKFTPADYKRILTEVTEYAYNYMVHIHKEIQEVRKIEDKDDQVLRNLDALVHTFDLVNDLIHPAHDVSRKLLEVHPSFIDYVKKMHVEQVRKHNPEPCWCSSCREEAQAELNKKNIGSIDDTDNNA